MKLGKMNIEDVNSFYSITLNIFSIYFSNLLVYNSLEKGIIKQLLRRFTLWLK